MIGILALFKNQLKSMVSKLDQAINITMFPNEPSRFDKASLDEFLLWSFSVGSSDISIQSGECIFIKIKKRRFRATRRELSSAEVSNLINVIYGDNGSGIIASGRDLHTAYVVAKNRHEKFRFRFNATGFIYNASSAYSITLRTILSLPPTIEEIGFPLFLFDAMSKAQGIVLITGETGSGKTTLQAAVLRKRVEDPDANLSVLTYEAPIEFVFDDIIKPSSMVKQHEVPRNLESWDDCVENAMRREPDIILIGESKSAKTMSASIEAARTGHLLMTTMHTNGVASTIRRAVNLFPEGERNGRAGDIIECATIILTQRLIKTIDGNVVPIREFLVFDNHIKEALLASPVDKLPACARRLTKEYGQTLADDAIRVFKEGLITDKELNSIIAKDAMLEKDDNSAMFVQRDRFDDVDSALLGQLANVLTSENSYVA